jgi:hypothetical protein
VAARTAQYSYRMSDAVYFADVELPFHVWVRERTGEDEYRWVLREAPRPEAGGDAGISDPEPGKDAATGSS